MTWRGAAVCDACGRVLGGDVASWHPMMPAASRASEPSFLENISHLAGCIRCGLEHGRLRLRRPRDAFVIRTAAEGVLSGIQRRAKGLGRTAQRLTTPHQGECRPEERVR